MRSRFDSCGGKRYAQSVNRFALIMMILFCAHDAAALARSSDPRTVSLRPLYAGASILAAGALTGVRTWLSHGATQQGLNSGRDNARIVILNDDPADPGQKQRIMALIQQEAKSGDVVICEGALFVVTLAEGVVVASYAAVMREDFANTDEWIEAGADAQIAALTHALLHYKRVFLIRAASFSVYYWLGMLETFNYRRENAEKQCKHKLQSREDLLNCKEIPVFRILAKLYDCIKPVTSWEDLA